MLCTVVRRNLLAAAMGAALLGLAGSQTAFAQSRPETTISLLGAPFGTATYVLCNALEQISKKHHPWLRISAAESPGFVFNLKKLDAEPELAKTTIFGAGPAVLRLATDGVRPFDKKLASMKLIGNFSIVVVWLATTDAKIKGPADLSGKRIGLGQAAQINWAVLPRAVVEHGWGVLKQVNVQYLGPKPAISALLDGKVDLAIAGGYVNPATGDLALSPQTSELIAAGRPLNHVSWGPGAVEKTEPKGYQIAPYTIPQGKIDGKNAALETFTDTAAWMVSPDFPEEIAYETTKLVLNHLGEFGEVHAIGKLMSKAGLVHGWKAEDIHPGALRAYKEAGVLK
ncbi:MAG TPA: TAXI family TRAP transporter solute-binding subunit [Hyphomicrobiaceae bacterium]|nr:TAXI family TRAP transporter solute-binding subunit [Hyphomicrobiaceae bacterium]